MDNSPADELRRMRQYSKCFTNAFDKNEPVFVLRAQDASAHKVIAQWIVLNQSHMGEDHPKIIAAKVTMQNFMSHPARKDAD